MAQAPIFEESLPDVQSVDSLKEVFGMIPESLDANVDRPNCIETTALGAAYLAGLATGYFKDEEEIKRNWQLGKTFEANVEDKKRTELLKGWKKAVKCALIWAEEE